MGYHNVIVPRRHAYIVRVLTVNRKGIVNLFTCRDIINFDVWNTASAYVDSVYLRAYDRIELFKSNLTYFQFRYPLVIYRVRIIEVYG